MLFDVEQFASFFDDAEIDKELTDNSGTENQFSWNKEADLDEDIRKDAFETQHRSVQILIDCSSTCSLLYTDYLNSVIEMVKHVSMDMLIYGKSDHLGVTLIHDGLEPSMKLIPYDMLNSQMIQKLIAFQKRSPVESWGVIREESPIESNLQCCCSKNEDDYDYLRDALFACGQEVQEMGKTIRTSKKVVIISADNPSCVADENVSNEVPSMVKSLRDLNIAVCLIPLSLKVVDCAEIKLMASSDTILHEDNSHFNLYQPDRWKSLLTSGVPLTRLSSEEACRRLEMFIALSRKRLLFHCWMSLPDADIHFPVSVAPIVSASARYPTPYYIDMERNIPCKGRVECTNAEDGSSLLPSQQTRALKYFGRGGQGSIKVEFTSAMRQSLRVSQVDEIPHELLTTKRKLPPMSNRIILLATMASTASESLTTMGTSLALGATEHLASGSSQVMMSLVDGLRSAQSVGIGVMMRARSDMTMVMIRPSDEDTTDGLIVSHIPWSDELRAVQNPNPCEPVAVKPLQVIAQQWDSILSDEVEQLATPGCLPDLKDPARDKFKNLISILIGAKDQEVDDPQVPTLHPLSSALNRELNGGVKRGCKDVKSDASEERVMELHAANKLQSLTLPILKSFCLSKSIATSGKKSDVIERIKHFISNQ
eukprot:GHVH01002083.1.p1 GENE.GHVH01002083.1~~GHVH01002083.1.p1  ORF type:complete len:653 (+),score=105.10 GHVH01002083.1:95-2053(+)